VNQADQNELHFALKNAEGELGTKVIYKDIKAWDADGNILAAKMETGLPRKCRWYECISRSHINQSCI